MDNRDKAQEPLKPFIRQVAPDEATGELAEIYQPLLQKTGRVAWILRCFSLRPDLLRLINELANRGHFSDGFLPRRIKEMIATYASALNRCPY